jgi:phosphohistidine phosphatase
VRRLTLVRHAKAEPIHPQISDFDRALTHRGLQEAERLARHLSVCNFVPDLLLTSPAQRTKQTAEILMRELALPANYAQHEESLYLAPALDMLKVARSPGPQVRHLMIVGHNPGISELAKLLAPDAGLDELATATAFTMMFDVPAWPGIAAARASTAHHLPQH